MFFLRPLKWALFDESERHLAIIKTLAKSHKGMTLTELTKATTKTMSGHFSEALNDLEASGFIQFIPFYGRKKGMAFIDFLMNILYFILHGSMEQRNLFNFKDRINFYHGLGMLLRIFALNM